MDFTLSFVKLFGVVPLGLVEMSISFGQNWFTMAHKLDEGLVDFSLALRASAAPRLEQNYTSRAVLALLFLIFFFSALSLPFSFHSFLISVSSCVIVSNVGLGIIRVLADYDQDHGFDFDQGWQHEPGILINQGLVMWVKGL